MRFTSPGAALVLGWFAAAGALQAQDSATAAAPAAQPDCSGPEYRQFDFWVGVWDVTNRAGKKAGVNRITKEENGCLIHEQWTGLGGTGQSMNFYDRTTGLWNQVWIDNTGGVLKVQGKYADRRLHYTGEGRGEGGKRVMHELTFFNNEDGTIRQLWRSSEDSGRTWQILFDGMYRRKAGSVSTSPQ